MSCQGQNVCQCRTLRTQYQTPARPFLTREVVGFREGEEGTINVYESDPTTVIGQFFIGNS